MKQYINENYDKHVVNISLAAGISSDSIETDRVIDGKIIAAAFHAEGTLPNQIITLTMKDTSGTKVQHGSTLKDWQQRSGGDYAKSMMPLFADGGKTYLLEFNMLSPLAAELKGQLVLLIDQTGNNNC